MSSRSEFFLLAKKELPNFPSASAIEFYKDRLYIIGDDSRNLLILDTQYNFIDSITLFPGESLRIPKKEKADLEAATIFQHFDGKEYLLAAGSGSTPERRAFYLFPLDDPSGYRKIDTSFLFRELKKSGLPGINIEGLAYIPGFFVFANRANLSQPSNYFILVPPSFIDRPAMALPIKVPVKFQIRERTVKGISGLFYVPEKDILFFTASVEHTANTFDDGAIGDSYLGYIFEFSSKITNWEVVPDELINLSKKFPDLKGQKIESVCAEMVGEKLTLHMVADNDNGTSTIFKFSMPNPSR